jgi:amino-acid N-acetyltransferase
LSDEIALAVSAALGAIKLFIVTVHDGLRRGPCALPEGIDFAENGRVTRLSPQETEAVLRSLPCPARPDSPPGTDKIAAELSLALKASRAGVERVHLIDARESGSVLRELFSNLGSGTMIHADEYESIRPLRTKDIADILRIMEPLMKQGSLIRRNSQDIQEKKEDYVVFEIDSSVHACGALHDWGEGQGEIAAIATDPAFAETGMGRRIVRCLIDRAEKQGLRRVFVLTTQTQDWFESLGFREDSTESLPERKRKSYDRDRKSKVFALDL